MNIKEIKNENGVITSLSYEEDIYDVLEALRQLERKFRYLEGLVALVISATIAIFLTRKIRKGKEDEV